MLQSLSPAAIIFDFDGVIADSEALANAVLADAVTGLGLPTTLDDALRRYQGRRWPDVAKLIQSGLRKPLPSDFADSLKVDTLERFRTDLREVEGAVDFIRRVSIPKCIASSSSMERLSLCLNVLGITEEFSGRVFSADTVPRGKPYPDIFLYAAAQMGIDPAHCLVIEDSPSGVQAGIAAGMTVIGLCAASHVRDGHAKRLLKAGAYRVVDHWNEVATLINPVT